MGNILNKIYPEIYPIKMMKKGDGIMARRKANITKLEILQVATRMFLEKGFTNTSVKAISNELDISTGNLTFHYHTKEDILLELAKEITDFHMRSIEKVQSDGYDDLFAYCWEVTLQITLCEENPQINDLYLAIYSHPTTLLFVKDWTAEKNYRILGERLSDWTIEHFRIIENVTCCIERSALTEPCTEAYTLEDKIRLTLTCLLKIYDISKEEREEVIGEILKTDYRKTGNDLLKQFTKYIEKHNQQIIQEAINERKTV